MNKARERTVAKTGQGYSGLIDASAPDIRVSLGWLVNKIPVDVQ